MKTATEEKPDLSEKITIRLSKVAKQRIRALCRSEHLDEAVIARIVLEAGVGLCESGGIEAGIKSRREFLNGQKATARQAIRPKGR